MHKLVLLFPTILRIHQVAGKLTNTGGTRSDVQLVPIVILINEHNYNGLGASWSRRRVYIYIYNILMTPRELIA